MKVYKKVKKEHEYDKLVELVCDMCGKKTPHDDWSTDVYEVLETEIRLKTGNNYPEAGSGTETKIDLCPECFEKKLIPWLKSKGVKVTEKEWDW